MEGLPEAFGVVMVGDGALAFTVVSEFGGLENTLVSWKPVHGQTERVRGVDDGVPRGWKALT